MYKGELEMDFNAMFQTWVATLTQPGEAVFEQEESRADLTTALIWMALAGVVMAFFGMIASGVGMLMNMGSMAQMEQLLNDPSMDPAMRQLMQDMGPLMVGGGGIAAILISAVVTVIVTPIAFLIGSGFYFLIAKLFGGTGDFATQTYMLAMVQAPIGIITSALNVVPLLGACVSFFVSLYSIVLSYYALKVSHRLSSGAALGVVLTPIVIIFLCICSITMLLIALISAGASSGGGF
jgi:hypothetical protein